MVAEMPLAKQYRDEATQMRSSAAAVRNRKDRISLLKIADEFERKAREIEALEATKQILRKTIRS